MTAVKTLSEFALTATPLSITTLPPEVTLNKDHHGWTFYADKVAVRTAGERGIYLQRQGVAWDSPLSEQRLLGKDVRVGSLGTDGTNLVAVVREGNGKGLFRGDKALVGETYRSTEWIHFDRLPDTVRELLAEATGIGTYSVFAVEDTYRDGLFPKGERLLLKLDSTFANSPYLENGFGFTRLATVDGLGGNGALFANQRVIDAKSQAGIALLNQAAQQVAWYHLLRPWANTATPTVEIEVNGRWLPQHGDKRHPARLAIPGHLLDPQRASGAQMQNDVLHVMYDRVEEPKKTFSIGRHAVSFGKKVVHPHQVVSYKLTQDSPWELPAPPVVLHDKKGVPYLQ